MTILMLRRPIHDLSRAVDVIGHAMPENFDTKVALLDTRPYKHKYAVEPAPILIEYRNVRLFPDEARELAANLIAAADKADEILSISR